MAHFADSVAAMLDAAADWGVPVLLATVPVNLRDWRPNVSFVGLEGDALERWRELHDGARRSALEGRPAEAAEQLEAALALAPLHAASHFALGRAREAEGRFPEARAAYTAAVDLDYSPWRASSGVNGSLRAAARRPDVHLVELERAFAEAAPHGLPGFDLFLDYVHPAKPGNLVVARQVFEAIVQRELLGPPATRELRYRPVRFHPGGRPFGPRDDLRLRGKLMWFFLAMHQYEPIVDVTTALLQEPDPRVGAEEREDLTALRDRTAAFLAEQRREILGAPFDPDYRARHERFMREIFRDVYDPARITDDSLDR